MVLHRDGICTDLFCFLSIPNSIPGSSTSLWGAQLPTYLLARNWASERFSWYTFFFHFISLSFVLQRQTSMMMMIWFVSGGARVCSRNGPEPDFSPLAASMSTPCDWMFH